MVAVPRSEFMRGVTNTFVQGVCIAAVCVVLALVLGLSMLNRVLHNVRQLSQSTDERPSFALLFIDLDHFKAINDHYEHDAGDRVLGTVATRPREAVRITDVVAGCSGDEFVVLLKG